MDNVKKKEVKLKSARDVIYHYDSYYKISLIYLLVLLY